MKKHSKTKAQETSDKLEELFRKSFGYSEPTEPQREPQSLPGTDPSPGFAIVQSDEFVPLTSRKPEQEEIPRLLKAEVRGIMQEVMDGIKVQLMKPMEQNAFFVAGKLARENAEIKEKLEIVLKENERLRDRINLLPAPPEEIIDLILDKDDLLKKADQDIQARMAELDEMCSRLRKHEKAVNFLANTQQRLRDKEEMLAETYREMERKHELINEIQIRMRDKEASLANVISQQKQLIDTLRQMQLQMQQKDEDIEELKERINNKELQIADLHLDIVKERNHNTDIMREMHRLETVHEKLKDRMRIGDRENAELNNRLNEALKFIDQLKEENGNLKRSLSEEKEKTLLQKLMNK